MDASVAIFATLTICLLFILAELAARQWFHRKGDYVWQPYLRTEMHLDIKALPNLPPVARFDINCDGERGSEPPRTSESVWRILVVGGSAAECYFLDQKDSWPEVLAKKLRNKDFLLKVDRQNVHVGNIGKSGVDTSRVDLIFDKIFTRYSQIDCIVLFLGAGDVVNWLCDGASNPFLPAKIKPADVFAFLGDRDFKWTIKRSAVAELARNIRGCYSLQTRKDVGKKLNDVRIMRNKAKTLLTDVPMFIGMLDFFSKNFVDVINKAKSKSKYVLVVRQPWFDKDIFTHEEERLLWHAPKGRPYEQHVDTYFSYNVFNTLMRAMDGKMVEICSDLNIPALDLKSFLPNTVETYYDHLHFTDVGANLVGEVVAVFINKVIGHNELNI